MKVLSDVSVLSAATVVLALSTQATALNVDAHNNKLVKRQAVTGTVITTRRTAAATATRRHSTAAASRPAAQPTQPAGGSVPMSPVAGLSAIGVSTTPEVTQPLPTTYAAGATPPVSGASPLPAITALNPANYPALDRVPPTDSPEVQQWLSALDMSQIPAIQPKGIDLCANTTYNAEAIRNAGASGDCWWSCGGCTAPTDITVCPTRNDWGVSFDDGPSPYTPRLLNMLNQYDIKATFFVVGSRVISRPEMVQTEYMMGHQISIHTWSHMALTTLTTEQIVAELGWTQKVIKDVIGVAPNTFRPPYGDIDNRVRAIAAQMGMTPIIWTSTSDGRNFDTEDWKIGAGTVSAAQVYERFESFMNEAVQSLSTGFIVLAHDLYQQSVDLATGYILPAALNRGQLSLKPISTCQGEPLAATYVETSGNAPPRQNNDVSTRASSTTSSTTSASSPASTAGSNVGSTSRPNSAGAAASFSFGVLFAAGGLAMALAL